MVYRALFVLVALQMVTISCSVTGPLDGTWRLESIQCAGHESAFMTNADIANSTEKATVVIHGNSAVRTWGFPNANGGTESCITIVDMNNIRYSSGLMTIDEAAVKTEGDCTGYPFGSVPANANLDYRYTIIGNQLTVTMPEVVRQNSSDLCGGANDQIDLIFAK
jgi:hypothetical protein